MLRFISSSYGPSDTYPAVLIDSIIGSFLAPMPDLMTSYCRFPATPSHAATSSRIVSEGLKPSDLLAANAIFLKVELVAGINRSVIRCRSCVGSSSLILRLCTSRSFRSASFSCHSGSSCVIIHTLLYTISAWSSFGATLYTLAPKPSLHQMYLPTALASRDLPCFRLRTQNTSRNWRRPLSSTIPNIQASAAFCHSSSFRGPGARSPSV